MIALLAVAGVASPVAIWALAVILSDRALALPAEQSAEMEVAA